MNISKETAFSIMESLLFMSSEPRRFSDFEKLFENKIPKEELIQLLEEFKNSYDKRDRGICLEYVNNAWQLRTKIENKEHLLKIKIQSPFRLSRPSIEVLAIVAYEQPCTRIEIDEIRGVESGHLLRTLIEKELLFLYGKSELPGKPSLYKTTNKFLEIFGLASLKDLPSQEEIAELLPQITNENKEDLESITNLLNSSDVEIPYEKDEQENKKIQNTLKNLPSSLEFLEKDTESKKKESQDNEDFKDKVKQ